jgi:hypothetical protein
MRLRVEFRHPRNTARALEHTVGMNRDATRVIAAVLEAPEALDEDGNDVALGNRTDDAAHD